MNQPPGKISKAGFRPPKRALLAAATIVWLLAVIGGSAALTAYAGRTGPATSGPPQWPADSTLRLDGQRATLVTFLHPHCPCSRATLANLARLTARAAGKLTVQIAFVVPPDQHEGWADTDLWRSAAEIGSAQTVIDRDGRNARLFGAQTSGQAYLFAPDGRLLFAGGLTPGRGHQGDCDGTNAVLAGIFGNAELQRHAPVFGCTLHDTRGTSGPATDSTGDED